MEILSVQGKRDLRLALERAVSDATKFMPPEEREKGGILRLDYLQGIFRDKQDLEQVFVSPWQGGAENKADEARCRLEALDNAQQLAGRYYAAGEIHYQGAALVRCMMGGPGQTLMLPSVAGWAPHIGAAIGLRTVQLMSAWYPGEESLRAYVRASNSAFAAQLLGFLRPV